MKKLKLKLLLLILLVYGFETFLYCQKQYIKNDESHYYENLVLETDRNLYVAGEKIWFKVNSFDNEEEQSEVLSKIIYLELYDWENKVISRGKFRIKDNTSYGNLSIPSDLISGNYILRAYTKYLRNFRSINFPSSLISVINPDKPTQKMWSQMDDITIVPERGKLIAGIKSRLVVRINQMLNKRLIRASILDSEKKEVLNLKPYSNGLAVVEFIPEPNTKYFLKLVLSNDSIIKPLPKVHQSGFLFSSRCKNDKLEIKLSFHNKELSAEHQSYKFQIKNHFFQNIIESNILREEKIEIPIDSLNHGIKYIVLKNSENEVIKVISIYVPKQDDIKIGIEEDKRKFQPRELVELNLNVSKTTPTKISYVISVNKKGTDYCISNNLPVHILYNPIFLSNYLNKSMIKSDSLVEQINALMILFSNTFNSKPFLNNLSGIDTLRWLPEIRDVSISGKLINKKNKQPVDRKHIYVAVFGENKQFHINKTKVDGSFVFSLDHLLGVQDLFICANNNAKSNREILINNDFSTEFPYNSYIPLFLDSTNTQLIEELIIGAQSKTEFNYHIDNKIERNEFKPLLVEDQLKTIWLKDFIELPTMPEVFEEIIPFVSKRKKDDHYYLIVYNDFDKVFYDDPLVLIDGVPILNIDEVMKINPKDVEKITINNRKYYLGENEINGVVRISTRTKNFAGIRFSNEAIFIDYQTITLGSTPVFQDYSVNKSKRIPDFRNLLYWNPSLEISENKKNVKFYAGDNCGEFDVIVRGYDNSGKLFYGQTIIKVEKP